MIVGVGIDVVPVGRFAQALERTSGLAERLFLDAERLLRDGSSRSAESLAARFAAKEAMAKALGSNGGMRWHDAAIITDDTGRPQIAVTGTVAARAATLGVANWHLSLSHDGGIAAAIVIAES